MVLHNRCWAGSARCNPSARGLRRQVAVAARCSSITGEAGIGKTRLADAFSGTARRAGASVVWGRGWEEGGAPAYWPWPQIIHGIDREVGPTVAERLSVRQRRHLARIVPEVGDAAGPDPEAPVDASDDARFELFAAVMAMLREAARERPLVIVLDDFHAADEPSLLLLGYVAEMLEEVPLIVLSVFRDEDLELGDARTRLLGRLARLPVTRPIQPRGLDERDVALLIEKTEGATVNDDVAAAIRRETDGNPLFVGEVARMLAEEQRLDDPAGAEWRVGPSAGVRAVIGRRLSRLSDETRSLLARASVLGKEFSLEVVSRLEGEPPAALIERFDPAVASRSWSDRSPARPGASVTRWSARSCIRASLPRSVSTFIGRPGRHSRRSTRRIATATSRNSRSISFALRHLAAGIARSSTRAVRRNKRAPSSPMRNRPAYTGWRSPSGRQPM